MKQRRSQDSPWRAIGLVSAIGVDLVVCILVGFYLGRYAMESFGGNPLWLAAGVVAGIAIGIVSVVFMITFHLRGMRRK